MYNKLNMTSTLEELTYKSIVKTMGTEASKVKEEKYYKMIEMDGVNLLDLGKCIKVYRVNPSYGNDGIGQIHFIFEKNNDNKVLWNSLYGENIFNEFINIIEYKPENT